MITTKTFLNNEELVIGRHYWIDFFQPIAKSEGVLIEIDHSVLAFDCSTKFNSHVIRIGADAIRGIKHLTYANGDGTWGKYADREVK